MNNLDVFVLRDNVERYGELLERAEFVTAYHTTEYLLAEEHGEESPCRIFVYEADGQVAFMPLIQREIVHLPGLAQYAGYYDIKTPHEYSGVLMSRESEVFAAQFYRVLAKYCSEHKIIFGFFRFNPYRNDNMAAQSAGYDVIKSDEQVFIDLKVSEDVNCQFAAPVRRKVRQAHNRGVISKEVQRNKTNTQAFINLYAQSMRYLSAKKFFFFNDDYFEDLIGAQNGTRLFFSLRGEKVLSGAIMLFDKQHAYYHLGCSDVNDRKDKPVESMFAEMAKWAKEHDLEILHLGGGAASLSAFKGRFSPYRVPYYIGWNIFCPETYKAVCKIFLLSNPEEKENSFKPLYRSKE